MNILEYLKRFDYMLFFLMLFIIIIGLLTIYSTQSHFEDIKFSNRYWVRQMMWFLIGVLTLFLMIIPKYDIYKHMSYFLYFILVIMLILVLLAGKEIYGAKRWLNLGYFYIQPSEFSKLVLTLTLSAYYSKKKELTIGIKSLILPGILFLILMALILKEPDLGTSIMLVPVFLSIVYVAGLRKKIIIIAVIISLLGIPLVYTMLKPYQKERVISFMSPSETTLSSGYQQRQSIIAVGSGGFFGKGFLKGTQSKLKFLPKHHTDLIFSAFAEEWGFFGVFILLSLYALLLLRIIETAKMARDSFGRYFCTGAASLLFAHVFVNIGMVIGLLPITGLPLPLMSYGGSFLLLNMMFIAVIINIRMRRFGD